VDADRIADRIAIQELKARYFRFLDTKQWSAWRDLFTDDMVFYIEEAPVPTTTEPSTTSGDDFVEMVSTVLAPSVTVHQGHMPEITFVDDRTAKGVWAMFDWVDNSSGSADATSMQGFGHYHETYRKDDDGRWQIAELRLTRLRVDHSTPTGAKPPEVSPWKRPVAAG